MINRLSKQLVERLKMCQCLKRQKPITLCISGIACICEHVDTEGRNSQWDHCS